MERDRERNGGGYLPMQHISLIIYLIDTQPIKVIIGRSEQHSNKNVRSREKIPLLLSDFAVFSVITTKFGNRNMKDYNDIAKQYAAQHGFDIVQPSAAERNGYRYFHLDFTGRPRYTGHPFIIKISPAGKVQQVLNFDEIYWAYNQRFIKNGQSV